MKNNVYLLDCEIYDYKKEKFNPSKVYKEGLNIEIESSPIIYDKVRNLLIDMRLDKQNIGKENWNPFKDFIKKGDKVVIKPNLVFHVNKSKDGTTDSLVTNFSIIRPIIDYTILALGGTGSIIVGDAPVQECIFDEVIKLNGLKDGIDIYLKNGYNIQLLDFRKNQNENAKCKIVSLDKDSSFYDIDTFDDKYAITNYNLKEMHLHHHDGKHEYLIAQDILESDVIINLPKPKVHRKAGITACMKNFIGVNAKKEYLPHHRSGSIHTNGDEFPEKSFVKEMESKLKQQSYRHSSIIEFFRKGCFAWLKLTSKNRYLEGSWYGNDTIWRTILDINKIINYADKNGRLTLKKQRVILNIADMIVSGEKEGPLIPSDKKVGMLVASFNSLNMDNVICRIMGFNPKKIKYIENGYNLSKYILSNNRKVRIFANGKEVKDINLYNKHFIPTDGWKDYLLKDNINS